jgi:uncharacterized membrane protein YhfC
MDVLFFAHLLDGLLMIAMPVGLAIFLTHRFHLRWRLWWIGAAVFVLSQVGHIPFNALVGLVLNRTSLVDWPQRWQIVFNAIFLGLSAGLFEELFRYGMFRWWAKDARSWRKGVLLGAGHGGAEAIILGVLVLYSFVQLTVLRNADLTKILPASQIATAQQQLQSYWSATWYASMLGALERLFTIPTQIALAVLVLQTFTRTQWFWVWLAVLYHALLDGITVLASHYINIYWTEAIIGFFAVLSVVLIFVLRQPEPPEPALVDSPPPGPIPERQPLEETEENLDNTRYQ